MTQIIILIITIIAVIFSIFLEFMNYSNANASTTKAEKKLRRKIILYILILAGMFNAAPPIITYFTPVEELPVTKKDMQKILDVVVKSITNNEKNIAKTTQNQLDIDYCEDIKYKLGEYSDQKKLYEDLELKALRRAVKLLLSKELREIDPSANMDNIIEVSKDLIKYSIIEKGGKDTLEPCVVLKDCYVNKKDRLRYNKVKIGKICNDNSILFAKQVKQLKDVFISYLRDKKSNVLQMMNQSNFLINKSDQQLYKLVHEETTEPDAGSISGTQCKTFFIYPIEIYAASSYKEKKIENPKEPVPQLVEQESNENIIKPVETKKEESINVIKNKIIKPEIVSEKEKTVTMKTNKRKPQPNLQVPKKVLVPDLIGKNWDFIKNKYRKEIVDKRIVMLPLLAEKNEELHIIKHQTITPEKEWQKSETLYVKVTVTKRELSEISNKRF